LNWRELNKNLPDMSEDTVLKALEEELEGRKRSAILIRLHQRYCTLRQSRERLAILERIKNA
jgi:hypothetical protein